MAKHIGIRSDRHKLICFYENKEWELYDMKEDSNEMNNVYGNPACKNIQDSLKQELWRQMKKYKDSI